MRAGRAVPGVMATVFLVGSAVAGPPPAPTATRGERLTLPRASEALRAQVHDATEVELYCFDSLLTDIINPGCFGTPQGGGDCASQESHFIVGYYDPVALMGDFTDTWRVTEVAFVSNDGDTVWPSVGVVPVPYDDGRFPTSVELGSLQAQDVPSTGDATEVNVDLRSAGIEFTRDDVLFMCIQFPVGTLTEPYLGPGILADASSVNPECDFFTRDAGANWYGPDPQSDPLDWGFIVVIEPLTPVEPNTWTQIKLLYGGARKPARP